MREGKNMRTLYLLLSRREKDFWGLCLFQKYLSIPLMIVLGFIACVPLEQKYIWISKFFYYACVLTAIITVLLTIFLQYVLHKTLKQDVDLEKWEKYTSYYYWKWKPWFPGKFLHADYAFSQAEAAYFKGDFNESLTLFQKINIHHIIKGQRTEYACAIKKRIFQNKVFLGQEVCFDAFKMDLARAVERYKLKNIDYIDETLLSAKIFYELLYEKVPSQSVYELPSTTKLDQMIQNYYLGLQAVLMNEYETARRCFESVATYSEKFYFVREARKWLETH